MKNKPLSEYLPKKQEQKAVSIRMSQEMLDKMTAIAKQEKVSLNKLALAVFSRVLEERGFKNVVGALVIALIIGGCGKAGASGTVSVQRISSSPPGYSCFALLDGNGNPFSGNCVAGGS